MCPKRVSPRKYVQGLCPICVGLCPRKLCPMGYFQVSKRQEGMSECLSNEYVQSAMPKELSKGVCSRVYVQDESWLCPKWVIQGSVSKRFIQEGCSRVCPRGHVLDSMSMVYVDRM